MNWRRLLAASAAIYALAIGAAYADVELYRLEGYVHTDNNTNLPVAGLAFRAEVEVDTGTAPQGSGHWALFPGVVRSIRIETNSGPNGAYGAIFDPFAPIQSSSLEVHAGIIPGDGPGADEESLELTTVQTASDGSTLQAKLIAQAIDLKLIDEASRFPQFWRFAADLWQLQLVVDNDPTRYALGRVTSVQRIDREYQNGFWQEFSLLDRFATNDLHKWSLGGAWSAPAGTLVSNDNVQLSTALYVAPMENDNFSLSLRLKPRWTASGNRLGAIYNYQDARNYYQLELSPIGTARLNQVINGVKQTVATAPYAGGANWTTVQITKSLARTQISLNGVAAFDIAQSQLQRGQVGVFTSWNPAQFDDVVLQVTPPVGERLATYQVADWTQVAGTWQLGQFASPIICQSNQAISAIIFEGRAGAAYQHNARVYSPWSASGNTAGLIYDFVDANNYKEVRLSPNGTATLYAVVKGVRTSGATSAWSGGAKKWVQVDIARSDGWTAVSVEQQLKFLVRQPVVTDARIGFISSWNLARFESIDVRDKVY